MALTFTCHTKEDERKEILEEYKKPDSSIRILVSVEALAKGFDVKDVGCVCDCRPLRKSLSTAIQMWGRGLRSSPDTGKEDCILLDFSGNIIRFREDFEDIYFNGLGALDSGERLDKTIRKDKEEDEEESKCPRCGSVPFFKHCLACGYERKSQSQIESVPGVMSEIIVGKAKAADNPMHLWQQICTYTRSHGNPETAKGRAWYLFRDIAKREKPLSCPEFERTPNAPITKATMNAIKARNIAFAKSRR
jgi:hypothetical protein